VIGPVAMPEDPPFAVGERETLVSFLDFYRSVLLRKAAGLTRTELATTLPPSDMTLGGLLKHMALVEINWFVVNWQHADPGEPWSSVDWNADPDWDFHSAADDSPEELYALWDAAVERADARIAAALADGGLDQPVDVSAPSGQHASLRRLIFDLVEEYGRHTGHADLLREAVDGVVGEDPPDGWRP
jgi:hypothetical protein